MHLPSTSPFISPLHLPLDLPAGLLQDEIVLFIMNKCSWDWWGDEMRSPQRLAEDAAAEVAAALDAAAASESDDEEASSHRTPRGRTLPFRSASRRGGLKHLGEEEIGRRALSPSGSVP